MGSFFSDMMIGYGTAGILFSLIVVNGIWTRTNEKRIHKREKHDAVVDIELKNINKKLDKIVNHFLDKGMK